MAKISGVLLSTNNPLLIRVIVFAAIDVLAYPASIARTLACDKRSDTCVKVVSMCETGRLTTESREAVCGLCLPRPDSTV